ncbi:MAG: LCP family protein [Chloroflexia bacterium]
MPSVGPLDLDPPSSTMQDLPVSSPATTGVEAQPLPAAPEARRSRPVVRAVRWAVGIVGAIVVVYTAWVLFALWRLEQRIVVPLPPTPSSAHVAAPTQPLAVGSAATSTPAPTADALADLPAGRTFILVMGTDRRENDKDHWPRSDTMILISLDTVSRTVRALSLPRDLVVDVPDYGPNKLNSAYLFGEYYQEPGGGKALALRTVSQFFNVPIDYYATINFEGFRKLVDRVGGVDINVPYAIDDYHYPSDDEGDPFGVLHVHFDAGFQHMNGKTALRYARTRHADNDFMRNRRQLQVIMAVRKSAMTLDLIPALPDLLDQLAGTVETNIPFDKQVAFAHFAYQLKPSDVITSTIDSEMIIPSTLPDGTEGFELDWDAAQPMLTGFFGRGPYTPGPTVTRTPTPTATHRARSSKLLAASPTRKPKSTPTTHRTLRPTATPTGP